MMTSSSKTRYCPYLDCDFYLKGVMMSDAELKAHIRMFHTKAKCRTCGKMITKYRWLPNSKQKFIKVCYECYNIIGRTFE